MSCPAVEYVDGQNVQFLDKAVMRRYIYANWTHVLCVPACVRECVSEVEDVFVHRLCWISVRACTVCVALRSCPVEVKAC